MNDAATPRLRPRTLAGYKQIINSHLKPNFGGIPIKDWQDSMCKP
jgi:integrase-like protein